MSKSKKQTATTSFWKRVNKTESCWLWTGGVDGGGYGQTGFRYLDQSPKAHRFSWILHNNKEIPRGMCVLHKCDNPPCVRPDHLFLGTLKDNSQDMVKKKRYATHIAAINISRRGTGAGVHWTKDRKWVARIQVNLNRVWLGAFKTRKEARSVYKKAHKRVLLGLLAIEPRI